MNKLLHLTWVFMLMSWSWGNYGASFSHLEKSKNMSANFSFPQDEIFVGMNKLTIRVMDSSGVAVTDALVKIKFLTLPSAMYMVNQTNLPDA